ncbi:low density lipoprotein receptor adapter protein 1 isoform X1 [Hydra vulgaris]|nr:low density lipoprotein receptor adapter protein 1 [Hydra vulgaris]
MDSLKVAAEKIKKSPRAVRKKLDNALHRERLNEDWILNQENLSSGVTFNVKFLGQVQTNSTQGKGCTDEAVEKLVQNKHNFKSEKLRKVSLTVNSKKLLIVDILSKETIEDFPLHQVSYCTADPKYDKVFAMIARKKTTKDVFIYAFLTNKKSMAEAISLTVAQAFTMAYEEWEEKRKSYREEIEINQNNNASELYKNLGQTSKLGRSEENSNRRSEYEKNHVTTEEENFAFICKNLQPELIVDSIHEDELDVEDAFISLAKSRTQMLDTGHVRKETFQGDVTDFLSMNNTYQDLVHAKSTEDLLSVSLSEEFFDSQKYPVSIPTSDDLIKF